MKKLFYSVFLLHLLFTHVYCQLNDSTYKKLTLGLSFEPAYTNRVLNYSSSNKWVQYLRNKQEIPAFGFSTGFIVRYSINEKWSIESGFVFINRAYTSKKENLSWSNPSNNYPNQAKTRFAFHYIGIPLKANYHWKVGKLDIYAATGISLSYFINKRTTVTTYLQDGSRSKVSSNNNYGYNVANSVVFGLGVILPVSKRIILCVEPTYAQNFTSIAIEEAAKEYLYAFGLSTKVLVYLKRKTRNYFPIVPNHN